jgi:hypothetical protein
VPTREKLPCQYCGKLTDGIFFGMITCFECYKRQEEAFDRTYNKNYNKWLKVFGFYVVLRWIRRVKRLPKQGGAQ